MIYVSISVVNSKSEVCWELNQRMLTCIWRSFAPLWQLVIKNKKTRHSCLVFWRCIGVGLNSISL